MNLNKYIQSFIQLPEYFNSSNEEFKNMMVDTEKHNPWFTEFFQNIAIQSFNENYFDKHKIEGWINLQKIPDLSTRTIGLVLAGNIPFVGMHDLLCVLITGAKAKIKMSSKDTFFYPFLFDTLKKINPEWERRVEFIERLEHFDAVIATGSNNSARYFNYYFDKYPHMIRKNRTSIAILEGNETDEEIIALGKDVFYFYGLGCRNVGKIFLPKSFDLQKFFYLWQQFAFVLDHSKYHNNYDYNRAILLLNQTPHLTNDFFTLVESNQLFSPLSSVNYTYYNSQEELNKLLVGITDEIQCVVAHGEGNTPFGTSQTPQLFQYADHVNVLKWFQILE